VGLDVIEHGVRPLSAVLCFAGNGAIAFSRAGEGS
jgi:hypothetical protein